jgi:hypothetical protein
MLVPALSQNYAQRVTAYRRSQAINQSLLKDVHEDPFCFDAEYRKKKKHRTESTGMTVGNITDLLLALQPEDLIDYVYVDTVVPPTEASQMRKYVDYLILKGKERYKSVSEIPLSLFEEAYLKAGFQRDSLEKVMNTRFPEEGYAYVESRLRTADMMVVSEYEHNRATDVYNSITTHPFTKDFFIEKEGERIEYQHPVFFTIVIDGKPVQCKALLDTVIFNENEKKITWLDTKCIDGHVSRFEYSYEKFQYYIQGAFYYDALIWAYGDQYEIMPPTFIVESFTNPGNPVVKIMSEEEIEVARHGGRSKRSLRNITGYREMISNYLFYLESKQVAYTKEELANGGMGYMNLLTRE